MEEHILICDCIMILFRCGKRLTKSILYTISGMVGTSEMAQRKIFDTTFLVRFFSYPIRCGKIGESGFLIWIPLVVKSSVNADSLVDYFFVLLIIIIITSLMSRRNKILY